MENPKITFITGNPNKAEQLSNYLHVPLDHHKLDLVEIQSLDLTEVTKHKTLEAYGVLNKPVIVDDTSLSISSLGKLPGPFIKFFLQELGSSGICKLIANFTDKSAVATVSIGYHDGDSVHIFVGEVKGSISSEPRGDNGFGWDNIFIPEGFDQTRGEMSDADRDLSSPRKLALDKLAAHLSQ